MKINLRKIEEKSDVSFWRQVGSWFVDQELILRRRRIGEEDLVLIRGLINPEGHRGRTHLSRRLCEIWDWRQSNGRFRQIACRDLLRRLHAKGLVKLPPMRKGARRVGYRNAVGPPELLD